MFTGRFRAGLWIIPLMAVWSLAPALGQSPRLPVYVEDSPSALDLVDKARFLRQQDRLSAAARQYQQIIDEYADKVIATETGVYVSAARWVRQELSADRQMLDAYRQTYEPVALRELEQACDPAPQEAKLSAVFDRLTLCPSGLEAALRLAGLYLEQAQPVTAAAILDELAQRDDLTGELTRWHLLQAAAGLYAGDQPRWHQHRQALVHLRDQSALAMLDQWSSERASPVHVADGGSAPVRADLSVSLPTTLEQPLWSHSLQEHLPRAVAGIPGAPAQRTRRPLPGGTERLSMTPLVDGHWLVINDGGSISSLDRISGRVRWAYRELTSRDTEAGFTAFAVMTRMPLDMRGVGLAGNRLLGIVGYASQSRSFGTVNTALVCLDRQTGRLLWRLLPEHLDEGLATAYFHGTPVIHGDQVYVLLRRRQNLGFQDAFVLSLDLASGRLNWRRHLCSHMPGQNSYGTIQPPTALLLHAGRLYVADMLSTVSCLDARNGSVIWLTIQSTADEPTVFSHPGLTNNLMPWQLRQAVLLPAGLVVPSLSRGQPPLLLDPHSGRQLEQLKGDAWSDVEYWQPVASHLLGLGRTVKLFDGQTLTLKWSVNLNVPYPTGQVSILADRVYVPAGAQLYELSLVDGSKIGQRVLEPPGNVMTNVLALDGQLILVGSELLRTYADWPWAQEQLRRWITQEPTRVEAGLALSYLAMMTNHQEQVLDGLDAALAALQEPSVAESDQVLQPSPMVDPRQQEVFREILSYVHAPRSLRQPIRRQLLDRLSSATRSPSDVVAYHMTYAAYAVSTGDLVEAMEHYQVILDDPGLAGQLYQSDGGARRAGLEARVRQQELVQQHGSQVYARYQALAAERLGQLQANGRTAIEDWLEVAHRYPLSDVAPQAMLTAANLLADTGRHTEALKHLQAAYEMPGVASLRPQVVGRRMELLLAAGRVREARSWLRRVHRKHPQLQLLSDGRSLSLDAWLQSLAALGDNVSHLPILHLPLGQPRVMVGQMLTPLFSPHSAPAGNQMLLRDGPNLRLYQLPNLQERWGTSLDGTPIQLLAMNETQVVLWSVERASVQVLDADTGTPLWPAISASTLLGGGDGPEQRAAPDQRPGVRIMADNVPLPQGIVLAEAPNEPVPYLVALDETVIVVADRGGQVAALHRASGEILWRYSCPFSRLDLMALEDRTLVMTGVLASDPDAESGGVVALDAGTGQTLCPTLYVEDPPIWIGLNPDGLLLMASEHQVQAQRLNDGQTLWQQRFQAGTFHGVGRVGDKLALLAQRTGELLVIDCATGELGRQVIGSASRDPQRLRMQSVDDHWYIAWPSEALALDRDAVLQWRDGITDADKNLVQQWIGLEHVLLLSRPLEAPGMMLRGRVILRDGRHIALDQPAGQRLSLRYKLHVLERQHGRILEEHELGPLPEPLNLAQAALMHNCLVLTTTSATLVIPGAPGLVP